MKKISFILLTASLILTACSKDESTQEEESARLEKMYNEIVEYSQVSSKPCTNSDEWAFMKLGASSCSGYIVYNKKIDVAVFQKKIDQYLEAQGKFGAKWKIYNVCMMTPPPTGIKCVDEKPTLIY